MFHLIVFCLFGCVLGKGFVDVNDILNADYMPGSLLLLEGENSDNEFGRNESVESGSSDIITGGSILEAYSTMGFHRKMMNEYLCRNFVADQILSDMSLVRIRRRLGQQSSANRRNFDEDNLNIEKERTDISSIKDSLLLDEGSAGYKHWLKKSATLEDIYRHYENEAQDRKDNERDDESNDQNQDEYEGDLTGYAVQGQNVPQIPNRGSKIGYGHSGGGGGPYTHPAYGGQSGYGGSGHGGSGHGGYDFHPHHQHVHYHPEEHEEHGKGDKELALADLFEIALTAIAFLSFGCYVLQVIMCITNSSTTTTAVTMMPMMMDPGDYGDTTGDDGDAEPVRYKRNIEYETINEKLNQLAKRILLSIESALVAEEDEGNCLRQQLCENNKYSRTLKDNQKYWVPVWSFGMSFFTRKFISRVPPASAMLDSLKASILGLGNANCKVIYSNCNLSEMRENRRRRRK